MGVNCHGSMSQSGRIQRLMTLTDAVQKPQSPSKIMSGRISRSYLLVDCYALRHFPAEK
jgi:hypothetical protein